MGVDQENYLIEIHSDKEETSTSSPPMSPMYYVVPSVRSFTVSTLELSPWFEPGLLNPRYKRSFMKNTLTLRFTIGMMVYYNVST